MLTLAWGLFLLVLLAGAGAVLAALLDCDAALLPLCCCWVLRWLWALSACARQVWERR